MSFALLGAGVSALGSLLGGRANRKEARRAQQAQERQIAEMNEYNSPVEIRARAEEAGYNPLLFAGPGVGQQTQIAGFQMSGWGDALAGAGMALGGGLTEYGQERAYATALQQQNEELRKQLEKATIRPKVPGIYGGLAAQSVATPATPAAMDRTAMTVADGGLSLPMVGDDDQGYAPKGLGFDVYPFRKPEVMTIKSIPIIADVELPGGQTFPVLHDGDEIMGIEKFPAFAAGAFYDHFTEVGRTIRRKTDAAGWTDPAKKYTPRVILDSALPKRYDPQTWVERNANRKPWEFGYKPKSSRRASGLESLGF